MIIGRKEVERKIVDDYEIVKSHIIKNPITQKTFDDICDWIGEECDYEHTIYLTVTDKSFFLVQDVIDWLEDFMSDNEDVNDRECEDYEYEKAKDYLRILNPLKEYTIFYEIVDEVRK